MPEKPPARPGPRPGPLATPAERVEGGVAQARARALGALGGAGLRGIVRMISALARVTQVRSGSRLCHRSTSSGALSR